MTVLDQIMQIAEPLVTQRGFEFVDLTYARESGTNVLRVLMDKPGGISLEDCSTISSELGMALDQADVISDQYVLEVSSPGLDRHLKTRKDFEWALGREVKVTAYAPIDKDNVIIGTLIGINTDAIVVQDSEGVGTEIPLKLIAKAKLHVVV